MLSDIEIAANAKMRKIEDVARDLGLSRDEIELYGDYKAKISLAAVKNRAGNKKGKLILVTAVNPTPAGEGKTTVTVGLGQALCKIGKNAVIALREPSLGPVFGIKGGAAGGGYSQVVPMEDINLHFTGDIHAVTAANNLLCAMIDNHIYQGNKLGIDQRRITFFRCMDMNDRVLRKTVVGLGSPVNGIPREDAFTITAASEIMAVLCMASDPEDLKKRLGDIIIGYNFGGEPVRAREINAEGALAALLKDAVKPNLVQTLEGTPAIMHGGPFANIAHGCNTVIATKLGISLADYCVTEAGFGSDLGAEKFFDIKCRKAGLKPAAVVLVATIRALKYNGGIKKQELTKENVAAVENGLCNLKRHISNMQKYNIPVVVAVNRFYADSEAETAVVTDYCKSIGVRFAVADVFASGSAGGTDLAAAVCDACEEKSDFSPIYADDLSIKEKIETVAREIYGAGDVVFSAAALNSLKNAEKIAPAEAPVCIAKTQYSFSDDPSMLGAPSGFSLSVRDLKYCAGAGFTVVYAGNIMTMPGLPPVPAAEGIDIDSDGTVTGLF